MILDVGSYLLAEIREVVAWYSMVNMFLLMQHGATWCGYKHPEADSSFEILNIFLRVLISQSMILFGIIIGPLNFTIHRIICSSAASSHSSLQFNYPKSLHVPVTLKHHQRPRVLLMRLTRSSIAICWWQPFP